MDDMNLLAAYTNKVLRTVDSHEVVSKGWIILKATMAYSAKADLGLQNVRLSGLLKTNLMSVNINPKLQIIQK